MASSSQHRCVFVGNIPYDATEEQLIQICEEVGPVVSFRLVLDRETGKPKGYGFCEYKDEETALSARRNLQGYEINGRQLRVDFAENDKNADRNRDQGRGGPGLAPNIDGQKTAIVTTVLGNSTIHQPMGLPSAANAASDMARVLGGFQISNLPGFQGQPGYGNDPLTLHLAKMSKNQLQEVISEMKGLITQDQSFARQVLQASPQLTKALFQAQIMLGLVPQQMLQMPLNNQSGSAFVPPLAPSEGTVTLTSAAQPALRNTVQPALPNAAQIGTYHQSQDGRIAMLPQNPLIPPQTTIPPRFKFPQGGQPLLSQGATVGKSGVETAQVHPQFVAAANVRQHHPSQSGFLKTSIQHPSLPLPAQNGSSSYRLSSSVLEGVSSAVPPPDSEGYDSVGGSRSSMLPTSGGAPSDLVRKVHDSTELGNQPSKRARLEGEMHTSQIQSRATYSGTSGPALGFISGLATTGQAANIDVQQSQHPEKQSPQLLPEAEAVLLQQVMKLTSEQLNSLPPEQRQQVIHLQRMFRG